MLKQFNIGQNILGICSCKKNRPRRDVFRVSRSNLMGSSRDFDMFENTESGQPPLPTPSQGFLGIEIEIYLVF